MRESIFEKETKKADARFEKKARVLEENNGQEKPKKEELKKLKGLLSEKMKKWGIKKLNEDDQKSLEEARGLIKQGLNEVLKNSYGRNMMEQAESQLRELENKLPAEMEKIKYWRSRLALIETVLDFLGK